MQALPQALSALADYRQWIVYKAVPRRSGAPGKMDKLPVDARSGSVADAHDPAIWSGHDEAIQAASQMGEAYGVGFVLTEADPFFLLDIDDCLTADNRWSDLANELMAQFPGAAVEVSHSGRGLHILGSLTAAPPHGCKNAALGLELYTRERFVALTGTHAVGDAGRLCDAELPALIARYFPAGLGADPAQPAEWREEPVDEWAGPTDDAILVAKARKATRNVAHGAFGNHARADFDALWRADEVLLAQAYPDNYGGGRSYDASQADSALAFHLAFWTGRDCPRMERLMRQSALYRDKWDRHNSYLRVTIAKAAAGTERVYTGKTDKPDADPMPESKAEPGVDLSASEAELVDGFQFLPPTQQVEHFTGCVYIQEAHRAFTPRGALLKPEQFRATYGGFVFALDASGDKTTKNAWEAFTESQAVRYPKAEGMTFRPELPSGALTTEEGRTLVNTFVPVTVERRQGDPAPFLDHLAKVLPEQGDRDILLAYMAACVQHIGVKFQWCPLLQGAEGNGKTLFTRCVAHAVGMKYSHFPKADEVGSKFNSWLLGKLFIGIEDVYYPDHRREIIEALKPLITNDVLPIELKGVDQISARVCANFILNSNHKDAIRKTHNDRRFAVFFTAQQSHDDILQAGMGGDYFPDLYRWLKTGGYAVVSEYLATYPIPEHLNPAGESHRAPTTSTTAQAIAHSLGGVEQEIMEAIEEGKPGFAGGWVSSMALDRLLSDLRMARAIPPRRRRDLMRDLGYDWHPALPDGRVHNPLPAEGGKPRLYVYRDSPDRQLQTGSAVVHAYQAAQARGGPGRIADRAFGAPPDER